MSLGARVVPGPDWKSKNGKADGSEGFVGTVAEVGGKSVDLPDHWVTVQWDTGVRQKHRVGHDGMYDLRVLDSAPTGISHLDVHCQACHQAPIAGIRWHCLDCDSSCDLCTSCYMEDNHVTFHSFKRIDSPEKSGVRVGARQGALKIQSRGIFPGAKVMRGFDWRFKNQDGGKGKEGTVTEITDWKKIPCSAIVVSWDEAGKDKYRLGYKGKTDLKCISSAVGEYYYRDHLACLGEVLTPQGKTNFMERGVADQSVPENNANGADQISANKEEAGRTPLHNAAIHGQCTVAERLLDNGESINVRDKFKMTPLHLACWYGQVVMVTMLLKRGADICALDKFQKSALQKAKKKGHKEIVVLLEEKLQRKEFQPSSLKALSTKTILKNEKRTGYNIFQALCLEGDYNKVLVILLSLADPIKELHTESVMNDAKHFAGKTARDIVQASQTKSHGRIRELFEETEIKVASLSELHRCSDNDDAESIVELVVENGVPVDIQAIGNRTPLIYTSLSCTGNVVETLVDLGANLNLRREDGVTAMTLAACGNNYIGVRILAEHGADLDSTDNDGKTPLHHTIQTGHHNIMSALIQLGCSVNVQDNDGFSPLHLATKAVDTSLIQTLLEKKANPNARALQDIQDRIHVLRSNVPGHQEWYCLLVNKTTCSLFLKETNNGIDCSCIDIAKFGVVLDHGVGEDPPEGILDLAIRQVSPSFSGMPDRTPLHFACQDNVTEIIDLLVRYEADINARDADDFTPLHTAVCYGKLKAVEKLVELKADVSLVTRGGMNALELATVNEDRNIEKLLKSLTH